MVIRNTLAKYQPNEKIFVKTQVPNPINSKSLPSVLWVEGRFMRYEKDNGDDVAIVMVLGREERIYRMERIRKDSK